MAKPPNWATRILGEVCEEEDIEEPEVVWWHGRSIYSSGRTSKQRIHITAGSSSQDRRLLLYHEMAHWVEMQTNDPRSNHDAEFFARVFRYVRRFGYCTMKWAKGREYDYREAAKAGYRQYRKEKDHD